MNKERNIKIEIISIEVDDFYFTIRYKLTIDGKITKDEYNSDYSSWEREDFEEYLEDGGALDTIQGELAEL